MSQSVIPYIGTFLGHLLMLHLLMGDNLEVDAPEDQALGNRILSLGLWEPPNRVLSSEHLAHLS